MDFFKTSLKDKDSHIAFALQKELQRQQNQIELIASENIVSQAVLEAQGSILTNKYAEGYPSHRYYGGCEFVDRIEELAQERAKQLFNCHYANVQPHSGAQANQAVFMALLHPGDTILGMSLDAGGHLTHGATVNLSGKWFNAIGYGVNADTQTIDYETVAELAHKHRPKLIIAGGSAYARLIDFACFREIANAINAFLMVDMAHFAGLVAGGVYPSPLPYAHVVTSTTHKTLRGPRGGLILTNDSALAKKINAAVFPGLQGGPLMHVIAAKAVSLKEALQPSFKDYARQVVDNAQAMAEALKQSGFALVSGGTDSHVVLVNLQNQTITGKDAQEALERVHMTCNKNGIPNDPLPPTVTSGIRLGSPAATSRGFKTGEFFKIGKLIGTVLNALKAGTLGTMEETIREEVLGLCATFPIYQELRYS